MIENFFEDALFAAIAAVGFASISHPPFRAYKYCAVIAAAGHSLRYILVNYDYVGIVTASLFAAFIIGVLAVFLSPRAKMPAETCIYPALLPMIPGIYAYKAFAGLAMCMLNHDRSDFDNYFYLFAENAIITASIILMLVIGATIPIFIFSRISFHATR